MAVTVTRVANDVQGSKRVSVNTVAMDDNYTSGGEALTAAQLGLYKVDWAECALKTTATTTVDVGHVTYDPATSLLHLWDEDGVVEITATGDVLGMEVQIVAYGA